MQPRWTLNFSLAQLWKFMCIHKIFIGLFKSSHWTAIKFSCLSPPARQFSFDLSSLGALNYFCQGNLRINSVVYCTGREINLSTWCISAWSNKQIIQSPRLQIYLCVLVINFKWNFLIETFYSHTIGDRFRDQSSLLERQRRTVRSCLLKWNVHLRYSHWRVGKRRKS